MIRALLVVASLAFTAFVIQGCASNHYISATEAGLGKSVSQLERSGWHLGSPTTIEHLETDISLKEMFSGPDWEQFKLTLQSGDELRQVGYNIELGIAVFRQGVLISTFLPVIVMT